MTLVADSGALYALYDADEAHHGEVREVIDRERGIIIVPTVILAELDYLLREFLGVDTELDFLKGIASGAYTLESFMAADLERCRAPGIAGEQVLRDGERPGETLGVPSASEGLEKLPRLLFEAYTPGEFTERVETADRQLDGIDARVPSGGQLAYGTDPGCENPACFLGLSVCEMESDQSLVDLLQRLVP